ncbi:MAG: hybrid sensor histidine kinase/response regulator [Panacagrimonas sp.]
MDLPTRTDRPALRRFLFALLASVVALLLRYSINGLMGDALPLMSGLFAVIVASWYGGLWPGLLATALCAIFGVSLFVDGGWALLELGDRLRLAGFLLIGTVTSLLFEALHAAQIQIGSERASARSSREQRERSQMQARDTELRHRLALEASFDAMYEWVAETDRMSWNEGVRTLFGYTDKEVDGSLAWWSERIHPADRESTLESFHQARQAGRGKWSAEYRLRCADGHYVWVLDRAGLVFDGAGHLLRTVGAVQDISEQRRGEERLRGILDAMPARVGTVAADGQVDYLHPSWAAYTGLGFDEVSGANWPRMFHPDDLPEYRRARELSLTSGEPFAHEVRVRRHDGEYRWHLAQMAPVRDAAGRVQSWVSAVTEVHELKLAQQRLRDADGAKDEFLATLAHELRNPIAPVVNAVQLLRVKGADDRLRASTLELMSRQLAQMVRLVDDLLDVSRITTGKLVLQRSEVSLAEVVRNAVESVDPLIRAGGHRLELVLPDHPVMLHGDAARLAQVLANLLNNSAKYSEHPGTICLSASVDAGELHIVLRDEGIGIAAEALPRVFDVFVQSDRTLSRSHGGLGIGLSLVRRLVEMHGGRVDGASEGAGRGSTFTVHLPLVDRMPLQPVSAPDAGQGCHAAKVTLRRRVLVADDNPDSAESLAALLDIWGHEVMIARDGVEALECAAAFKPDVMVLDLGMPRRDGLDTAREVRAQPWGGEVTLIALSGWGQPADRERTRAAGFDHHLVKPVDGTRLEKLIEAGTSRPGREEPGR